MLRVVPRRMDAAARWVSRVLTSSEPEKLQDPSTSQNHPVCIFSVQEKSGREL